LIKVDASGGLSKTARTMAYFREVRNREVKMADKYLEIIRAKTPEKTGETRKSWTVSLKSSPDAVEWTISPVGREEIVAYLEYGTKDHVIEGNPLLSFYWEKLGTDVVFKWVHHPGTKPLAIVRLTQDEIDAEAKRLVDEIHATMRAIWPSG
jgi:hypothetical protein